MIDADRLWATLAEINEFGALDDGGVERLAWTEPEVAARAWLVERCRAEGFATGYDEIGNVWAFSGERPAVVMGSHLDTVPNGGRFDGSLGITSALEALLAARDARVPGSDRLGLVCFTDEESVRFGIGMPGSRAVAGDLSFDEVAGASAADGTSLSDLLTSAGLDAARVGDAAGRRGGMAAYLELHIEQGRRLERADLPVGIVSGIVGLGGVRVEVSGEANHAGTTFPADRRDALVPLAVAVLEAKRLMYDGEDLVATVGQAEVLGGASNIVPGRTRFTLDVRSTSEAMIKEATDQIVGVARDAAQAGECAIAVERMRWLDPAPMDEDVIARLRAAAREMGLDAPVMPSMAGHDAMNLARAGVPCGMVFVRSKNGISHSPQEHSSKHDCAAGAELLLRAALNLAGR